MTRPLNTTFRRARALVITNCLILTMAVSATAAQQPSQPATRSADDLPSVSEILGKFVKAMGGEKALRRHTSSYTTGAFSIPSQGMNGTLEVYAKAPNKSLTVVQLEGFGTIKEGFDGKTAWSTDPASGPQVFDGAALEVRRIDADFFGPLNFVKNFKPIRVVDRSSFEDELCYKVEMVDKAEYTRTVYFSVETGLLHGVEFTFPTPMGDIPGTIVTGEYKDFGGIMTPIKTTVTIMGMDRVITVKEVEYDSVDDTVFDLPQEIRNLVPDSPTTKPEKKEKPEKDDG